MCHLFEQCRTWEWRLFRLSSPRIDDILICVRYDGRGLDDCCGAGILTAFFRRLEAGATTKRSLLPMPATRGKKSAHSLYSVHPGVQMVQDWIATLKEKTE